MSVDYTQDVVGRDPLGKIITESMVGCHPDWTDRQIAERINQERETPLINAAEVAHWRKESGR